MSCSIMTTAVWRGIEAISDLTVERSVSESPASGSSSSSRRGCCAGAVGADDEAALARSDRQRYVLGHRKAAERLLQVVDLQRVGRGHGFAPRFLDASLRRPGMIPVGITSTMNRNTRPSSMFQRST